MAKSLVDAQWDLELAALGLIKAAIDYSEAGAIETNGPDTSSAAENLGVAVTFLTKVNNDMATKMLLSEQ